MYNGSYLFQGPLLVFVGMATSDRPHVDILGPIIPLFYQRHDDDLRSTAARFFGAAQMPSCH